LIFFTKTARPSLHGVDMAREPYRPDVVISVVTVPGKTIYLAELGQTLSQPTTQPINVTEPIWSRNQSPRLR
jgi:hypothetical protein